VLSKKKNKPSSHDYHGSVGSTSLNIAEFDNRRVPLLEVTVTGTEFRQLFYCQFEKTCVG
jgi:hypothetical protein